MLGRILAPTLVLCLTACSIGGSTLQEWSEAKEGEKRLSAFLADPDRPFELRRDALDFLMQGGHYTSIMGVFGEMDKPDQKFWVKVLVV